MPRLRDPSRCTIGLARQGFRRSRQLGDMPRITGNVSIRTRSPLTTIKKLVIRLQIALPDLWLPGGGLHDAAFAYSEHMLTKNKASPAAFRLFKLRIGKSGGPGTSAPGHIHEAETSQTASQRAQQQLQDPTAQLTDDVLDLLLRYITLTSRTPDAKVLDPLYIQVDKSQESCRTPVCYTRIFESSETIFTPLHYQS
ncbi:hypothetical protein FDENT_9428 [Fusarium denticulatum]|uniref:Uncharacterized protein n=1 Tax=Fusarium denticulatum TaxID=48507 RepID=A0A8H5WZH8_9HYPO|nr:hypothetical protein FDENT_9428 [Fusarium denticulatum]